MGTVPARKAFKLGSSRRRERAPGRVAGSLGARRTAVAARRCGGTAMALQGAWREGREHSRQSARRRPPARLRRGFPKRSRETLAPYARRAAALSPLRGADWSGGSRGAGRFLCNRHCRGRRARHERAGDARVCGGRQGVL